jgi:hypothetical protein
MTYAESPLKFARGQHSTAEPARRSPERTSGARLRCLPPRLQDGARRHRLETAGIALSVGAADWLKFKNPKAPAVKREAEEDWGK